MQATIKKTATAAPIVNKITFWDKIKMYFGWGKYALLPDVEPINLDDDGRESIFSRQSMPYIVTIENTGKKEEQAVIFGEYKNLTEDNYGNKKCIKLSSSIANVSYVEIMRQLSARPEEFSLIRLQSINTQQILEPLKLTAADANGNEIQKVIIPNLDPYQQQCTIVQVNETFVIDGNLNIKVKILPGQTLQIYLYPASRGKQISSFDSLANLIGYERKKYQAGNYAMVG